MEPLDSHDALLQREETGTRRRRRQRRLAVLVALVLVAGVAAGARPALHVVKAWQARRLARQAVALTEAGKLDEARPKVQDALGIWRLEPEAMRAAALLLTRAGVYRPAVEYWRQLDGSGPLAPADLRDYAAAQLNLGDTDAARTLLRRVWPDGTPGTRPDWLLAMQVTLRRGNPGEAATLAARVLHDPSAPPRERLGTAAFLATSSAADPGEAAFAWKTLAELAAANTTPESLSALVLLAQERANHPDAPLPAGLPALPELLARLDAHPLAKAQQILLALDIRLAQEPARRAELIQAATDRFGGTKDDADLAALAAWLYVKGEYDRVLAVLPPARIANDRALYLQRLDALAALGRWTEIRASIQSRQVSLDPMLAQMFLARCAAQLGEPEVSAARWQAALGAAGKDPAKLTALGQYAVKNGADRVADAAFAGAVRAAPDTRPAHEELVRFLESAGDTPRLRAAVADLLARWPQDAFGRNEAAYLDALQNENLPAARNVARELVQAQPASLSCRATLALCELRLHNPLGALDAFNRRAPGDPVSLQAREAAVYAAVLWEAGFFKEAAGAIKDLPVDHLLPEERALIQPITGGGGPA